MLEWAALADSAKGRDLVIPRATACTHRQRRVCPAKVWQLVVDSNLRPDVPALPQRSRSVMTSHGPEHTTKPYQKPYH
jgi:hypothetical protein